MLFSPIPVPLNAQAEPLGWGLIKGIDRKCTKKITDTIKNLLELKQEKLVIWTRSDQSKNWGAATRMFNMASVWARSHDICREKRTSIPNSTLDHFNIHSYTLQWAAAQVQCCSGILVLQMHFSSNGLLSSNDYSEKSGRQGQAAAEWKVKTWKMLDEYLCRAIFTLALWCIMGSAKLTEFTLRELPLWELSLICT